MPDNALSHQPRIIRQQQLAQPCQTLVLRIRKHKGISAFQLDAQGIIIAIGTSLKTRLARMPGPVIAGNKLQHSTITPDQKMGGNFETTNCLEIRIGGPIKPILEKVLNGMTIELARRQTDIVDD